MEGVYQNFSRVSFVFITYQVIDKPPSLHSPTILDLLLSSLLNASHNLSIHHIDLMNKNNIKVVHISSIKVEKKEKGYYHTRITKSYKRIIYKITKEF